MISSGTDQALQNLINAMGPWWGTLEDFVFFGGLAIVVGALTSMYKSGKQGAPVTKLALFSFVAGVLMTSLPAWMDSLSQTAFQTNAPSALTLNPSSNGTGEYATIVTFVFDVLMLVGLIATVKALLLFRDTSEDRSKMGPAIGHLVGGVVALNMKTMLLSLGATVGGVFQTAITKILGG
ncbi:MULTISPECIES: hypothetical protein [Acidithiobacillus]|uniref:Uncharacterized protein n=1 Tax=Acidithiobacillus sulfurivorans TaxID=1958756 RepID=A0ABS5ZVL1_9PROT|nr:MULTISPECIES: hypothetical protein [Acidithiobacillus]MBU2742504.1 hypothetical protein [Acidithiobacillus albertensis]MBU2759263.1 hypothetical protein [Acidithiobacillus sulfurivorans]